MFKGSLGASSILHLRSKLDNCAGELMADGHLDELIIINFLLSRQSIQFYISASQTTLFGIIFLTFLSLTTLNSP